MIANQWLSVRDDFVLPAADPEDDSTQQAANREFLSHAHDWQTVGGFYPNQQDAGRSWQLWSVYYPTQVEMVAAFSTLQANNPGRTRSLGGWLWDDGSSYLLQFPQLIQYMPVPLDELGNPLPNFVRDLNLLAGQTPRQFT